MILSHKSEGPLQRWIFGLAGLGASLVLVVVSIKMNWAFGMTLGRTPDQGLIYAQASAAADVFKVLSPFFLAAAWKARSWSWVAAAALIWVITCAYGTLSATGHAALNRADSSGARTVKSETYKDSRAMLKRATDDLSWIPAHRPSATIQADLQGLKSQRMWSVTSECSEAAIAGKSAREFCQGFYKLTAELENAKKADVIEAKIADITGKLSGADGAVIADADPQASMIARLTTLDLGTVNFGLIIFVILLLEVCSGLGPYVSIAYAMGGVKPQKAFENGTATKAETPPLPLAEVVVTVGNGSNNGPDPVPAAVSTEIHPTIMARLARPPMPESIPALQGFGYPVSGKPRGELRKVFSSPKATAQNFVTWLQAYDLVGTYSPDELIRLYKEFARRDHREETADNFLRDALARLGKRNGILRLDTFRGERKRRWVVYPGRFAKTAGKAPTVSASAETQPEAPAGAQGQQSAQVVRFRPFGAAAALVHDIQMARAQKREFQSRVDAKTHKKVNRFSRARGAA